MSMTTEPLLSSIRATAKHRFTSTGRYLPRTFARDAVACCIAERNSATPHNDDNSDHTSPTEAVERSILKLVGNYVRPGRSL